MKKINWEATKEETKKISEVVKRALEIAFKNKKTIDLIDLHMDIAACHLNGCALDLDKLLGFDDFNFAHDVFGISGHIDRETGELKNSFLPRASR